MNGDTRGTRTNLQQSRDHRARRPTGHLRSTTCPQTQLLFGRFTSAPRSQAQHRGLCPSAGHRSSRRGGSGSPPGWTAPLRAPAPASGSPGTGRGGAAGQRARPARGSAGKRRRARGPGEGDPPGGGEKPPALINHWELTAGKAKARPGSSAPGTHPLLCGRAGPETGSGGGCGQARGAGRGSP